MIARWAARIRFSYAWQNFLTAYPCKPVVSLLFSDSPQLLITNLFQLAVTLREIALIAPEEAGKVWKTPVGRTRIFS